MAQYAFIPCTAAPSFTDKNWIEETYGGYNIGNIIINKKTGSILPNCTGWVHGRWTQMLTPIFGLKKAQEYEARLPRGNAETYWTNPDSYERGHLPALGAIIIWKKGKTFGPSDGAGHVAVVEAIDADGNIEVSASNYSGTRWYKARYTKKSGYYLGKNYTFLGFLYPPVDFVEFAALSVPRDHSVDQVEVKIKNLNVRTGAGTGNDRLGYAQPGFYNVIGRDKGHWEWYEIEKGKWIAVVDGVRFLPKEETPALYQVTFPKVSEGDKAKLTALGDSLELEYEANKIVL